MTGTGRSARLALLLGTAAACGGSPEPEVQPLPSPDGRPALLATPAPAPAVASYQIEATLDDAKRVRASQTLTWVNTSTTAVTSLPFHLYLNAFKNESSHFMQSKGGSFRGARPVAGDWGWIDLVAVSIDGGEDLTARLEWPEDPDETVVRVPLDRPVLPGATIKVAMSFEAQLPVVMARTGHADDFTVVAQWFPKIGVLAGPPGAETWHCQPHRLTSEFFADFGTYNVALTVADTLVVAATGVLTEARDNPDDTRTLTYHAESVHDFVWVADPYLESMAAPARTSLGEVEVTVLFREDQRAFAERHLHAGVGAIERFSELLVPYPWSRMTIVDPPPGASRAAGMEYPTLVTTGGDSVLTPDGVRLPEFVTVHEVGHNWFQGILASNEVDAPWLDEGLNEYVDSLVMGELYGADASAFDWGPLYADTFALRSAAARVVGRQPDPLAAAAPAFVDLRSYAVGAYARPLAAMRTLEHAVDPARFRAALGAYAREMAFRHPTEADLVRILERELGEDLDWFLAPALHGTGSAELAVRSIDCRRKRPPSGVFGRGEARSEVSAGPADDAPYQCAVVLENPGSVPVPVEVELTFEDGRTVRRRWDDRGGAPRWTRIEIEDASPVVQAVIDPDGHVLLDDGGERRGLRVTANPEPVVRAAARGQFWTQTAMQVFGL